MTPSASPQKSCRKKAMAIQLDIHGLYRCPPGECRGATCGVQPNFNFNEWVDISQINQRLMIITVVLLSRVLDVPFYRAKRCWEDALWVESTHLERLRRPAPHNLHASARLQKHEVEAQGAVRAHAGLQLYYLLVPKQYDNGDIQPVRALLDVSNKPCT
eukprot:4433849-Pyramimonas_sp.AAC.3